MFFQFLLVSIFAAADRANPFFVSLYPFPLRQTPLPPLYLYMLEALPSPVAGRCSQTANRYFLLRMVVLDLFG